MLHHLLSSYLTESSLDFLDIEKDVSVQPKVECYNDTEMSKFSFRVHQVLPQVGVP